MLIILALKELVDALRKLTWTKITRIRITSFSVSPCIVPVVRWDVPAMLLLAEN